MRVIDAINIVAETAHMGKRNALPSDNKTLILDYLNLEYEKIFKAYPWDNIKQFNITATTSTGVVVLPNTVGAIRAARISTRVIYPIGELFINNFTPKNFDEAGTPVSYTFLPNSPLLTPLSSAQTINIKSSSTSDTSGTVRVEGTSGGVPYREELTINGTTDVPTTSTMTEVTNIIKPLTVGRIIVQNTALTEIGQIDPDEYSPHYIRIQLSPIVETSTTVTFQCLRKFERLVSDNDSIIIPAAEAVILDLTIARCWERKQNIEQKQVYEAKASEELKLALNAHDSLNLHDDRSLPAQGFFYDLGDVVTFNRDISVTGTGVTI